MTSRFLSSFVFAALTCSAVPGEPTATVAADSPNIHLRGGMAGFAARAEAGEELHVATLGGSITQNAGGHSKRVPDWLSTKFPEAKFVFTNAGLGSTCSTSGAFRVSGHILEKAPLDLLIVEYAVNDNQDANHAERECLRGMEGIVRRVHAANPACEILMMHYVNQAMLAMIKKGEVPTSIKAHEAVAAHYGITSVNVAGELADAEKEGRYTWKEYGGVHPADFGYKVACNMVTSALEKLLGIEAESTDWPSAIDPHSYDRGRFVHPDKASWNNKWTMGHPTADVLGEGGTRSDYFTWPMARATQPGASMRMKFNGNTVGAFVLAGPDAGSVESRVDGGEWTTTKLAHQEYSKGMHYPRSIIFAAGLEDGNHTFELRIPEQQEGDGGTTATILWLEINGEGE